MKGITWCCNHNCPQREICHRYRINNNEWALEQFGQGAMFSIAIFDRDKYYIGDCFISIED